MTQSPQFKGCDDFTLPPLGVHFDSDFDMRQMQSGFIVPNFGDVLRMGFRHFQRIKVHRLRIQWADGSVMVWIKEGLFLA